jgi:hypothetical protein
VLGSGGMFLTWPRQEMEVGGLLHVPPASQSKEQPSSTH